MELEKIYFPDKTSFHQWLEKQHESTKGIWMVFYKKHTGKQNISYEDAMEEAICFGWIDSIIKKLDEESYLRKFTPRKDFENWSELNKKRAEKLLSQGKLRPAGFNTLKSFIKNGQLEWPEREKRIGKNETLEGIMLIFGQNEPALKHFLNLAPSYQKHYMMWILDAKKESTRQKRIREAIELLKRNQKLSMK